MSRVSDVLVNSPKRLKQDHSQDKEFKINDRFSSPGALSSYKEWINEGNDNHIKDDLLFTRTPFTAFQFQNFLSDRDLLISLMDQVNNFDFKPHENDLFRFSKTDELNDVEDGPFGLFQKFVCSDLRRWVQDMCSLELDENKVDLFAAKYNIGDVLLCHDDQVSTRKIAFILYLCPDWQEEDGGKLDLISTDEKVNPVSVAKSLGIGFNVFNFFIVCPTSFHQVAEVVSPKIRLSISGWFHSVEDPKTVSGREFVKSEDISSVSSKNVELSEYVNATYLTDESRGNIRDCFEESSFILLYSFLEQTVHDHLLQSLKSLDDASWRRIGPLDVCNYDVLTGDHQILDIIKSPDMCQYLTNVTQVEVGDKVHVELMRLGRGMYSLLNDKKDVLSENDCLCCFLTLNDRYVDSSQCGGYFVYLDDETGEELERVPNSDGNSLGLAYVNAGTNSFLKYINCEFGSVGEYFYVVKAVFPEIC